jgi:hypothetical protein
VGSPRIHEEPMLDELKAVHMSRLTQTGKRMMIAVSPSGRVAAFIYRTGMTDANSMRVLEKYGMDAHTKEELANNVS